jgi:hypothetical protein
METEINNNVTQTDSIKEIKEIKMTENIVNADSILKQYEDNEDKITSVQLDMDAFKRANRDIFDTLQAYQNILDSLNETKDNIVSDLKNNMRESNTKSAQSLLYTATYSPSYNKKNFNTTLFYKDYEPESAMYQKYVGISTVTDSVKIKKI